MDPTPEHRRIAIKLPNDSRALPALEATIEHLARRAGMPDTRQQELARAVREVYRAAFASPHDGSVGVTVEGFDDRVEVRFECAAAGLRALAGKKPRALARISRVGDEKTDDVSRLVLVQYVSGSG